MALDPKVKMFSLLKAAKPRLRLRDGEDTAAWRTEARARLGALLGLPLESCDSALRAEWTKEDARGFTVTRLIFESEPEVDVCCNLLLPEGAALKKLPLIICLQGHSTGMHISMGQARYPGDEEDISGGDRDFAIQAVKRGYAALTLEQRAFGERGGSEKGPMCRFPAMQALLLGQTIIGQRVWDVSRAIDAVCASYECIDQGRIAVTGNSGGGTTSIYAAAMDERISAAMPSCAFCGYYPSIGAREHCVCNYVPGIINWFDMGDLAGLIAPRPLIVVNGLKDAIFPIDSAREQADVARAYYAAMGASERFEHVIGPEGHRFYADLAWPVFERVTGWGR